MLAGGDGVSVDDDQLLEPSEPTALGVRTSERGLLSVQMMMMMTMGTSSTRKSKRMATIESKCTPLASGGEGTVFVDVDDTSQADQG